MSATCCIPYFSRRECKNAKPGSVPGVDFEFPSVATWATSKSIDSSGTVASGRGGSPNVALRRFTISELKSATNKFSEVNVLGEGGYGRVYKATLSKGVLAAVKRAAQQSFQGEKEFHTEIELLSSVAHPNLVRLLGYCNEKGTQMLVYEYIPQGTLRSHLSRRATRPLTFQERVEIMVGAANGIAFLHSNVNPIIHRDIKTANILLTDDLVAKVADFGLGKLAPDGATHVSTVVKGTMGYMDPDYYMTNQLTEKSDVYSFGVVILEVFTGRSPISKGRHIAVEMRTYRKQGRMMELVDPTIKGQFDDEVMDQVIALALACCCDLPKNRPTMTKVAQELKAIANAGIAGVVLTTGSIDLTTKASSPITGEEDLYGAMVSEGDSLGNTAEYEDPTMITTRIDDWTQVVPR
ncbi:hypothetical protein CBR_g52386 [Chara braunii]|uniref:Protein kinase domain-containing protein n=1 Tax=Chara braunii TaxID=69332 RepID=A0A388MA52_CHABU|nr:hypothetical protein CBR_g52386 [Chara braunii]|eukprot:GBG91430.1 hypothetical protein CBR_g52386 [Chara braunii]